MTPLQIKDWMSAAIDPGAEYELGYLVTRRKGLQDDKDFAIVLEQRRGVKVLSTKLLSVSRSGTGVMQAVVTISYADAPLGPQVGQAIYTPSGAEYRLTNVFLRREGSGVSFPLGPLIPIPTSVLGRTTERAGQEVTEAANATAEQLEKIGLAPRNIYTIAAVVFIGAMILSQRSA